MIVVRIFNVAPLDNKDTGQADYWQVIEQNTEYFSAFASTLD